MSAEQLKSWRTRDAISLDDAVAAALQILGDAHALVYTPDSCALEPLREDLASDFPRAWEMRAFSPQGELRWVKGEGAALLREQGEGPKDWTASTRDTVLQLDRGYLLWGEVEHRKRGVWMVDHRIAPWPLPGNVPELHQGTRVRLFAREYAAQVDDHGNVSVIAERLVRLCGGQS